MAILTFARTLKNGNIPNTTGGFVSASINTEHIDFSSLAVESVAQTLSRFNFDQAGNITTWVGNHTVANILTAANATNVT